MLTLDMIEPLLPALLGSEAQETNEVARLVAARLEVSFEAVAKLMGQRARHSAYATHDGAETVAFGRVGRRWRWHATPQRMITPPTPPATLRLDALENDARVAQIAARQFADDLAAFADDLAALTARIEALEAVSAFSA